MRPILPLARPCRPVRNSGIAIVPDACAGRRPELRTTGERMPLRLGTAKGPDAAASDPFDREATSG